MSKITVEDLNKIRENAIKECVSVLEKRRIRLYGEIGIRSRYLEEAIKEVEGLITPKAAVLPGETPLTFKESRMLGILKSFKGFTSPTIIGQQYGYMYLGRKDCHSSTASPALKELVRLGFAKRSIGGWYKAI